MRFYLLITIIISLLCVDKYLSDTTPPKAKDKSSMAQFSGILQKQMLYFFPLFTVFILWKLPSAIALYWIVTSLFSIGQQRLLKNHAKTK